MSFEYAKKSSISTTTEYAVGIDTFSGIEYSIPDPIKDLLVDNIKINQALYDAFATTGTGGQVLLTDSTKVYWGNVSATGGIGINSDGTNVGYGVTILDFRGSGISTITVGSGIGTINIEGGVGSQGLQGTIGIQGIQGLDGAFVAQGIQGIQGTQGLQGIQGISVQGIQGSQGVQGTRGVQGLDGAFVAQGIQGTTGSQGIQGITGTSTQGIQGTEGSQGIQGITGTGIQGIQGITGPVAGSANQVVYKDASNNPTGSSNLTFNGTLLNVYDLNVQNNLTIGGTSVYITAQELRVQDKEIVLGFTTTSLPTDTTANHGGIAIASTEGTPLVSFQVGTANTLPDTYKQIMWVRSGTYSGLGTDAWLFNYGVGIGSTQVPFGVRLAVGGMQVTDSTLSIPQLRVSGVSTFVGLVELDSSLRDFYGNVGAAGSVLISTGAGVSWTSPFAAGLQGVQGIQGSQGTQGIQGITGTGTQGTQGIQGITGTGTQGIQGIQGIQGASDGGFNVSDNTTTNSNWYVGILSVTSGIAKTTHISSTKFQFNPSTGALGIGTIIDIIPYDTLNSGTLSWEGSAGQLFSITNNLTTGSIFSVNDVSGIPSIDVNADGTIQLGAYGGNVGVGTTRPTSKLHVQGDVRVSGVSTFVGLIKLDSSLRDFYGNVGAAGSVLISTGAGVSWTVPFAAGLQGTQGIQGITGTGTQGIQGITGTGTQGIQGASGPSTTINAADDTTTATLYPVMVAGTGTNQTAKARSTATAFSFNASTCTLTAVDFNSTSDIKLKTNIKRIENAIDKVNKLEGVTFNWIRNNRPSIGIIAQDVEKLFPELVNEVNGEKTVNYNGLIGVLIEAIKGHQTEIQNLETKVKELDSRLKDLL